MGWLFPASVGSCHLDSHHVPLDMSWRSWEQMGQQPPVSLRLRRAGSRRRGSQGSQVDENGYFKEFQCGERCWSIGLYCFFFNEVPIFQRKPIASINHRTCKLSRSWNPCASFLRLEQDEEEYEGILYGYGFSYASLNNMGSGMQGQPVSIWGLKRFMCPRVVSEFSASSNHFWVFFSGASKLSEPTNLNNSVHNSQRWLAGPIWTHLDPPRRFFLVDFLAAMMTPGYKVRPSKWRRTWVFPKVYEILWRI